MLRELPSRIVQISDIRILRVSRVVNPTIANHEVLSGYLRQAPLSLMLLILRSARSVLSKGPHSGHQAASSDRYS